MGLEHLTKTAPCPPLQPDKLRIYGNRSCPFTQRILLTSAAKKIPVDIVFINLKNKPDWIFGKSALGKTPMVETKKGKVLCESLIIADYLDEAYQSGRQLHQKDPLKKAEDRILIENFGKVGGLFYNMIYNPDTPAEDIPKLAEEYEEIIAGYAKELESRGTKFFGGDDEPGMLDYMIWPMMERRPVIKLQHSLDFAKLTKDSGAIEQWVERMKKDEAVKMYYIPPEKLYAFFQTAKTGVPEYNMLFQ